MLSSPLKKSANYAISNRIPRALEKSLFSVALILTAISVFVPFLPFMPGEGLDPSWVLGMNQAIAQGLIFGKDIVFTYGPYSSILTKSYHPATDHLMVWGGLYLGLSFSFTVYQIFKNKKWESRAALLLALAAVMYSQDALFFFYPLLVGVHIFEITSASKLNGKNAAKLVILLFTLFAPFGIFPLIKGSILISCVAITIFSGLLLSKDGWWLALFAAFIPLISMSIFWVLADQPLVALPTYFKSMFPIINGYTEAMDIDGNEIEFIVYLIATAVLVGLVFYCTSATLYARSIVSLMFLCVLFLAFKAGFVRHDGHAVIAGTMILIVAILASTLIPTNSAAVVLFISFATWIYIDAAYVKTSTHGFLKNITSTYFNTWHGVHIRFSDPRRLQREFDERITELKVRGAIPSLIGTVDIYSYDQSYLIASGNKWTPRPVLQSYSVYTADLAEKNKGHLLGSHRPDNIIFKVQPIDGRLPSIEDGSSWPTLISRYEPRLISDGYLYLKHRKQDEINTYKTVNVLKGRYSFGERIDLPSINGLIFAKITIKKTILGDVLNTIFKPSKLNINIAMENGSVRDYRIIAPMGESGFILSPLIEATDEFGVLFADAKYLDYKKVKSIKIEPVKYRALWGDKFEIQLFSLEFERKSEDLDGYGFSQPLSANQFSKSRMALNCEGNIDSVNGVSPSPKSIDASFTLNIHGWMAVSTKSGDLPEKVFLVLRDAGGNHSFFDTVRSQRPDVGAHFNNGRLNSSGFTLKANVSKLKGDYVMSLAYSKGESLYLCPEFNIQTKFHGN